MSAVELTPAPVDHAALFEEHRDGWHVGYAPSTCHNCETSDMPELGVATPERTAAARAYFTARNDDERRALTFTDWEAIDAWTKVDR
ncbi:MULTISPECIES: hypothetical protein [unclassified Frondihabitans]|uniref:hypothetical protein n=1 Tax=unclassified Frondihabitans TaxID=2626248 RepID=UPI000F508C72|nr:MULTISPECIES: hypothetical protein [unclassified Frondihabitans]RPE75211.1 hypothetical protein EDF37_2815 [Frondihabitans sp. PhB153]RPF04453.1 hypothetical protein EDF39_2883 [Frondihabitans sp. PhB161]